MWNDTDRGKSKFSNEKFFQFQVFPKQNLRGLGRESNPLFCAERQTSKSLNHGKSPDGPK